MEKHNLISQGGKAFTPTPIYIVAVKLKKTSKTILASFQNYQPKCKLVWGFTLVEMLVAMALMAIIFAAIVPEFRAIRNSWASSEESSTIIQNGRVLEEHLYRNLSSAKQILSVSPSGTTTGFIIFKDTLGVKKQYKFNSGYVDFNDGTGGAPLAGPVSRFQISCYAIDHNYAPTTDVNMIRCVSVATDFNTVSGTTKTFTTSAYLQTNANVSGLVGWWKLDETSGTTAVDSSGNNNNGTLVFNDPNWMPTGGAIGGALGFDGTNDYVDLGDDSSLNFEDSEPFTIAAWIKTTAEYGLIVSLRNPDLDGADIDFAVGDAGGGCSDPGKAVILVRQDSGGQWACVISKTPVNDDKWYHVAVVRTGNTVELFVDGNSQGKSSGAQAGGAITTNVRAIGCEVYWDCGGDGSCSLAGTIDDVRIYQRALTAAEIKQLANVLRYKVFTKAKVPTH